MRKSLPALILICSAFIYISCGQKSGAAPSLDKSNVSSNNSTPCNPCKIFGTDRAFTGNLRSIPGGVDKACKGDINRPSDDGTYKVLYMLTGVRDLNTDWVLHPNTTYQRPNGTIIGTTDNSGKFPTISAAVTGTGAGFWTGMNYEWTPDDNNNCSGYANDTTGFGTWGRGNVTNIFAFSFGNWSCSDTLNLYCVEQ